MNNWVMMKKEVNPEWFPGFDGSIVKPFGNGDHSAIKCNIYRSGNLPTKSNTVTFNFKRGNEGIH